MKSYKQLVDIMGEAAIAASLSEYLVKIKRYGYRVFTKVIDDEVKIFKHNGKRELTDIDFLINDYLFEFKELVDANKDAFINSSEYEHYFTIDFTNTITYYDTSYYPHRSSKKLIKQDVVKSNIFTVYDKICWIPGFKHDSILKHYHDVVVLNESDIRSITGTLGTRDHFIVYTKDFDFKIHEVSNHKEPDASYVIALNQILTCINPEVVSKCAYHGLSKDMLYIHLCEQILKLYINNAKVKIPKIKMEGGIERMGSFYKSMLSEDMISQIESDNNLLIVLKIILITFQKNDLKHIKYISDTGKQLFQKTRDAIENRLSNFDPLSVQIPSYKQWAYNNKLNANRVK